MQNKSLVVIDIQNDITKNYKEIIDNINQATTWAVKNDIHVAYIKHYNLSPGTRTLKPNTKGSELASDLTLASHNIFEKSKGNALTSEDFATFIVKHNIKEFYITGADAIACVKSTVFNMCKENYHVTVLSDCITSYDKRKIDEMLDYYEKKGSTLLTLRELMTGGSA